MGWTDLLCVSENKILVSTPRGTKMLLTFDDGQSAPLDLLPAAVDEPLVDLLHQLCQVVRVRLHNLVKLCKLNRGERYMVRAVLLHCER